MYTYDMYTVYFLRQVFGSIQYIMIKVNICTDRKSSCLILIILKYFPSSKMLQKQGLNAHVASCSIISTLLTP